MLDAALTISVPKGTTAFSGIDALSHIIEAAVSQYASTFREDLQAAPEAADAVFRFLKKCVNTPDDLEARAKMLTASHRAGLAFRRASTGYVHAIAHRLGEIYHLPHGLAIAAVLPFVLRASRPYVDDALAKLAAACGMQASADVFLEAVDSLIAQTGIDCSMAQNAR